MGANKEIDDRFNAFGTVSFMATSKVNDFIDHLKAGKVMGTRCKDCDRAFFPPRSDCPQCLTSRMGWFEITGPGRLISYSRLQFAPVGFQEDVPYCIAVLDYGDFKVFGRIDREIPESELQTGMAMTVAANELGSGQFNYVFRKAS